MRKRQRPDTESGLGRKSWALKARNNCSFTWFITDILYLSQCHGDGVTTSYVMISSYSVLQQLRWASIAGGVVLPPALSSLAASSLRLSQFEG